MRIVVVDDEPLARDRLRRLLGQLPGYQCVGEASDGESALELIDQEEPELVLLDIRMGGMDGLTLARRLARYEPRPAMIFTTAYPEHALSAFEVRADGYLIKPIRVEKLQQTLAEAGRLSRAQHTASAVTRSVPARTHIPVPTREGLQRIPVNQILCFVADQKYTTVSHLSGESLIEEPLKSLEAEFSPAFLRVHRKALVAVRFVAALERSSNPEEPATLRLQHSALRIPVSRRRLAELRRALIELR